MKVPYSHIILQEQRFRKRPKKFRHYLQMTDLLFEELMDNRVLTFSEMLVDDFAWFEFTEEIVIISFQHYYAIDTIHFRILNYLLKKEIGIVPIQRGGTSF